MGAGFLNPAMVAGQSLGDFAAGLRRLEAPISSHGSYDFLVERFWRLSTAHGPRSQAAPGHGGGDETRRNRVGGDAPAGNLICQRFGHANHTRLRGGIVALSRITSGADDR